ncbi:VapC toxin family PIN domain ribonuclease [Geodermatophilus sp. TF02-6]|uniref:type II toxin-antitoxin system VapC family toxin n=1 Tax=Geodermatophilus sp. TF02-6 TaxID=2250575 RepID=UPI000DE88F4C|nr:type II toxin-antitoxin system VapC family toxin [Geodermatophilus sp. TF02-6]RBY77754.1 VapC toxin family PIN domain ribonuclease [Geodermatophilus sp. TF02-6]
MIVLDTNVISELVRPRPAARVTEWLDVPLVREVHVSAVTVAEIEYGLARLPDGRRRRELRTRVDRLLDRYFPRRVLPFDSAAAQRYGTVMASRERLGRPIEIADAQIAAICLHHDAALATRNTRDFEDLGLTLIDPWEG